MGDRMFAAVLPPDSMVEELDELLASRRETDSRLRWTKPHGWHLTTAFMADVPDVFRLEDSLEESLASVKPFDIRVASGLAFPHPVVARVIGLGVTEGEEELGALAMKCRNAANRAGASPDGARFVGHLTLARINGGMQATRWLGILDSFPGWSFRVDEVSLIRSRQMGRSYEPVARFELGKRLA